MIEAIKRAKKYLQLDTYSRAVLVMQLKLDGFTKEVAEYAADNCGVDWNDQAVRTARRYCKQHLTGEELISQLRFEQFTQAQAEYAVSKITQ